MSVTSTTGIPARGLPDTVTVITAAAGTPDRYGNVTPDWANATSRPVAAFVQPESSTELFDKGSRDALAGVYRMFTNDLTITGYDRIVWNGLTLEVSGPPSLWDNPAGAHHMELQLRDLSG